MTTLSVDLAYKNYADIGVIAITRASDHIVATPVSLSKLGLSGPPSLDELADALEDIARREGATRFLIDGPQGWKGPNTGEIHSRKCERELATQGKTGLPGITKPGNYVGFITFSIDLFDELDERGWLRLDDDADLRTSRLALESFPTAAWRALGLTPLPGKAKARPIDVLAKLNELRGLFPLDTPEDLTHDELQALVSGLAGLAFDDDNLNGFRLAGIEPYLVDEIWREGYIINPTHEAAGDTNIIGLDFENSIKVKPHDKALHQASTRSVSVDSVESKHSTKNVKKIFIPTSQPEDWKQLLAEPDKQWKKNYSARALAYCWQEANGIPKDVAKTLSQIPEFKGLEALIVIPEHQVPLPGGARPSQNDCWVLARTSSDLVSIAVEGKVSESFGPKLGEWLKDASPGKTERLSYLCSELGLDIHLPESIRYQLLHRTVSALIEAKRFHAKHAVMVVHSFSQTAEWFDDYQEFTALFGARAGLDKTVSIGHSGDINLHVAWVNGNKRYLTM